MTKPLILGLMTPIHLIFAAAFPIAESRACGSIPRDSACSNFVSCQPGHEKRT